MSATAAPTKPAKGGPAPSTQEGTITTGATTPVADEAAPPQRRFKYRFRVTAGTHRDLEGPPGADGKPTKRRFHWRDNPVVETDVDLAAKFNTRGSIKFIPDNGNGSAIPDVSRLDLTKLSTRQLLALAQDEGVDLKGASERDEIIKVLQPTAK